VRHVARIMTGVADQSEFLRVMADKVKATIKKTQNSRGGSSSGEEIEASSSITSEDEDNAHSSESETSTRSSSSPHTQPPRSQAIVGHKLNSNQDVLLWLPHTLSAHPSDIPESDLVPNEPPPAHEDEALALQLEDEDRLNKIEDDLDREDEQRLRKQLRSSAAMDLDGKDETKKERSRTEYKRKAKERKEDVEEVEIGSSGRHVKTAKYIIDSDVDV